MKKAASKRPSAAQLLTAVPHPNESMRREENADGTLLLTIPLRRPLWLVPPLSWVLPFGGSRRVELDELGACVLNLCDGHNTVERIITQFSAEHKLSFREAQVAVTQFLKMLTQRGIVVIVAS